MTLFKPCLLRILIVSFCLSAGPFSMALEEQVYTGKIASHFKPAKPTVSITYNVTYRLLGMNLLSVAQANLEATEGFWTYSDGSGTTPCCLINIILRSSRCDEETKKNGRIYINDRLISVSTMPDLNTLYYIKKTDEFISPPFKQSRRIEHTAVYDLETGTLNYRAENYLTGEVQTNLTGAADMATQGKEVSKVLQMVSDVYHKRRDLITPESDFRLMINCDGIAVPFAAQTSLGTLSILGHAWPTLCAEVLPAKEAPKIRSRDFSMWATSVDEVAEFLDDPALKKIAEETPAWGMMPLLANYGLALGCIRCTVVDIKTIPNNSDEPFLLTRAVVAAEGLNPETPVSN